MKYKNLQKTFLFQYLLIILILLLSGIVVAYKLFDRLSNYSLVEPSIKNSPTAPQSSESEVDYEGIPDTFSSTDLGITFNYITVSGKQGVKATEIGNKVYLYMNNSKNDDLTKGKYVEVFSKDPNESLESAITKKLLKGYPRETCTVTKATMNRTYLNPKRIYMQIVLTQAKNLSIHERFETYKKCPKEYTFIGNGLVYFMMDVSTPDKYVFFNIGQDNFIGSVDQNGNTTTWDQTLRFY